MIKLISLDLDGTLLTPEGTITAASREAIARARAAGLRVVINTGRPAQESMFFARRAMELCLSWDVQLLIYAGNEILVNAAYKKFMERWYPFPAFHKAVTVTEDFLGFMAEHDLPLVKIHGELGEVRPPVEELAALPDVTLTTSSGHDFELTAGGADKGAALAVIAERYGVPLDRCAAVGDSENDLSAFRVAGLPIAMGNAPEHVKAAAARIAPSNGEEGAAWAVLSCLE